MSTRTDAIIRGLIAGDASSSMNADFQIYSLPAKRVNRLRMLNALSDSTRTTNVSRPFAHANPPALLHPAPGEAIEWFTFSYRQSQNHLSESERVDEWLRLAELSPTPRVRIGTRVALMNLKRGLTPARSGNDNPHYFDDLAMVRAVAAVLSHPDDWNTASREATTDAQFTTALDGLWCAQATALLFNLLMQGNSPLDAAHSTAETLPVDTWSRRLADASLVVAESSSGAVERARRLSVEIGDWIYNYPIAAPETLGFLLAHVAVATSADDLLLGALSQPRNGAVLPALAGAAAAAIFGTEWIPGDLALETATLNGIAFPEYRGQTIQNAATIPA